MAILACVPGIEVTIKCNGTQLQEYTDDSGDGVHPPAEAKTVTKYVKSTANAEFSINFSVKPPFKFGRQDIAFFVSLDGKTNITGCICQLLDLDKNREWKYEMRKLKRVNKKRAFERTFKFARLLLTEDNIDCMSKDAIEVMQKVGLIEIKVFRAVRNGKTIKHDTHKLEGYKEIPEKAIKGQSISHSIAYGDEKVLPKPFLFSDIGPALPDLQREMIIPKTPSLEKLAPRSIDALTVEEKRRLARMQFEDTEMLRSLTGSNTGSSDGRTFDDLDENEISVLAKKKYEQMTGSIIIKREMMDQDTEGIPKCINPVTPYKMVEIGNGRTAIDLDGE